MYLLEGNIGAGKSTFLKLLAHHLPVSVTFEPLHNWQQEAYGQSLLADFYNQPDRWAYTLETLAMMARVREHLVVQDQHNPYRIMERSVYSGYYCFAYNGYKNGFLTDIEWDIHNQWFSFLVAQYCKKPLGFIYLRVDPAIAYQRIQKRGRAAEKNLTLSYLQDIDKAHENFLIKKADYILPTLHDVPVLVLDCNQDFEDNPHILQSHLDAVAQFIKLPFL
jgi:deoxyadenosine/deoxycytidine kinase